MCVTFNMMWKAIQHVTKKKNCTTWFFFLGHETFAHGAARYGMRNEERKGNTSQGKKKQARHHPRWDKRVISTLSDEESVDPNSEWSQYATREYHGVSGHTLKTRACGRS